MARPQQEIFGHGEDGQRTVRWDGDELIATIRGLSAEAMFAWAQDVADLARELAPVDGGNLQANIYADVDGTVHADTPYAAAVNFGSDHVSSKGKPYSIPAQPFLSDAVEQIDPAGYFEGKL